MALNPVVALGENQRILRGVRVEKFARVLFRVAVRELNRLVR